MTFSPNVGDTLKLANGATYRFAEHPAARGFVHSQDGRRAMVYRLTVASTTSDKIEQVALKVYKSQFKEVNPSFVVDRFRTLSTLPGMHACDQHVISERNCPDVVREFSELANAVQMPWVVGVTWQELLMQNKKVSAEFALALATNLVKTLASLEQAGIAHCDLSGANVLVDVNDARVALVDFDDMFAADLKRPAMVPAGSDGYAHFTVKDGYWAQNADRFSGAIMLAEMLTLCSPVVRTHLKIGADTLFTTSELHTDSEAFRLVKGELTSFWGEPIAQLFSSAWASQSLANCPTFSVWNIAISEHTQPSIDPIATQFLSVGMHARDEGRLVDAVSCFEQAFMRSPVHVKAELSKTLSLLETAYQNVGDQANAARCRVKRLALSEVTGSGSKELENLKNAQAIAAGNVLNVPIAENAFAQSATEAPHSTTAPQQMRFSNARDYRKDGIRLLLGIGLAASLLTLVVATIADGSLKNAYVDLSKTYGQPFVEGLGSAGLGLLLGLGWAGLFSRLRKAAFLFPILLATAMGLSTAFVRQATIGMTNVDIINLIAALGSSLLAALIFVFVIRPRRAFRWFAIVFCTLDVLIFISFSALLRMHGRFEAVPTAAVWAVVIIGSCVVLGRALATADDIEV